MCCSDDWICQSVAMRHETGIQSKTFLMYDINLQIMTSIISCKLTLWPFLNLFLLMIHFIPWSWRMPATPGSLALLVVWRGSISKGWGLTTLMGNFHMQYLNTGSSPSCHTIFICIFINRECVGTKHSALMFSSLIHDVSATMKYADAMTLQLWKPNIEEMLLQVCCINFHNQNIKTHISQPHLIWRPFY